jgi:hypothetical protein
MIVTIAHNLGPVLKMHQGIVGSRGRGILRGVPAFLCQLQVKNGTFVILSANAD